MRDLDPALLAQVDQEMTNLKIKCGENNIPWTMQSLNTMHFLLDSLIFAWNAEVDIDVVLDSMHITVQKAEELMELS